MVGDCLAEYEDLPGGWIADQICAVSYFNAAADVLITTADVELVAKYTTGVESMLIVELRACTPLISVFVANWHHGPAPYSSSEEKEAPHLANVAI